MILCYLDESGTPAIPGNTSHYVLAGLTIPIDKWKKCESDVRKLKTKFNLSGCEIHTGWIIRHYKEQEFIKDFQSLPYDARRHEVIKNRKKELLRLNNPKDKNNYHQTKKNYRLTDNYIHLTFSERISFINELAQLIGSWKFCRLFAECIDKIHFDPSRSRYSVDEQAFEQVVSRFEQYLNIYSASCKVPQFGLLIHDNNPTVSKRHTALMKSFHKKGTLFTKIDNIIETPLYVDSELTSMIQLADVCGFALRKYLEKGEETLFKLIYDRADKKDNKVVGVRHFSEQGCNCFICKVHK
jgi:hypothetical protein